MVAAVIEMTTPVGGKPGEIPVSQASLRSHLKLSKSTASYRVRRLLELDYLANLESRKGKEMKLVPGAPLPDEPAPLPSPCELSEQSDQRRLSSTGYTLDGPSDRSGSRLQGTPGQKIF